MDSTGKEWGEIERLRNELAEARATLRALTVRTNPKLPAGRLFSMVDPAASYARDPRLSLGLSRVIESLPDGVLVLRAGQILYANPAFARSVRRESTALIGTRLSDLVHPDQRMDAFGELHPTDVRFRDPQGAELILETSPQGEIEWTDGAAELWIIRDVSERRKMWARILFADRLSSVGMLAAGVAHEINNPLAAIIANLELANLEIARLPEGAGSDLEAEIGDATEAARRVRDIVRDLKIFSRGDEDRRELVDLHALLESAIRVARNEIRHRARLVRDFGPIGKVLANEASLAQAFVNLLVNAAQAIPDGHTEAHEIRVVTRAVEDRIHVEVRDTGSGMSPDILEKIFTPFFTTKPIGVGSGLGLPVAQGIVHGLGGEISVESRIGAGSVFIVDLPAAGVEAKPPKKMSLLPPTAARSAKILVIDDEEMIGTAVRRILGSTHSIDCFTDARQVVQKIASGERFDLILCDLMMPELSGEQLREELLSIDPGQAEAMVFMTGGAFTATAREFVDHVPNVVIDKPFDPKVLRGLVADRLVEIQ